MVSVTRVGIIHASGDIFDNSIFHLFQKRTGASGTGRIIIVWYLIAGSVLPPRTF